MGHPCQVASDEPGIGPGTRQVLDTDTRRPNSKTVGNNANTGGRGTNLCAEHFILHKETHP